ncbi:MAG: hypothetical protein Q7R41_09185 [Phycisphaerales bacterium]|nr:hypothetical protein [Phycisphaerales bacterium]
MDRQTGWRRTSVRVGGRIALVVCFLTVLPDGVRGDAFTGYQLVGRFSLPPEAAVFDALADGRIIALAGANVYVESAPASRSFSFLGTLPGADFPSFGAAFLAVSPDGTRFAAGNNGGSSFANYRVGVFSVALLSGEWFAAAHFDGAWIDDTHLALTAGDFVNPSIVTVLDTTSIDPNQPTNPTIINGIGGASAGVALDPAGNLYTGNGFVSGGPSGTGAVRAFRNADWTAALSGGPVLNFETDGIAVVDILSASPLGFDNEGNLFIGGGDFSNANEFDFVALVRASAIADALAGMGPANAGDAAEVRRLDPDPANDFNFFSVVFNPALGRLYAKDAGNTLVHFYQDTTGIPAVSTWGVITLALLTTIAGTLLLRQRTAYVASVSPRGALVDGNRLWSESARARR